MTTIGPGSPCEVAVMSMAEGGIHVEVFVPTYDGGAQFTIEAERDAAPPVRRWR